jgi:hypothetical protein
VSVLHAVFLITSALGAAAMALLVLARLFARSLGLWQGNTVPPEHVVGLNLDLDRRFGRPAGRS